MFEPIVENLCKVVDSTIQMQQELLQKWVSLWPTIAPSAKVMTEPLAIHKGGMEIVGELFKKEYEWLEAQFSAGVRNIEEVLHLVKTKDPEEFRSKSFDLWQKGFESCRQLSETQLREFKNAATKWTELVTRKAAA